MAGLFKTVIRVGLITALAGGVALAVAGPDRTKAAIHQAHDGIMSVIDEHIDDPVALRSQLRELEAEYPKRIAQVRRDLGELSGQIKQLEREHSISNRVVSLVDTDLEALQPLLADAERNRAGGKARMISVTFNNRHMTLDQAYVRANQIGQTRIAYANRAADAEHDLGYLRQQAGRLEELLVQLETERSEFQAQIWQLERQVDAIARNERLIGLMEDRKRTIDDCSRYEAGSLDQLHARLSEVRSRQEAELEYLATDRQRLGYEEMAKMQLNQETGPALSESTDPAVAKGFTKLQAEVIERD